MQLQKIIDILTRDGMTSVDTIKYLQEAYNYVVRSIRLDQTVVPVRFNSAMKIPRFGSDETYGHITYSNSEVCFKDIIATIKTNTANTICTKYESDTAIIGDISTGNYGYFINRDAEGNPIYDDGKVMIDDGEDITEFDNARLYQKDDIIVDTDNDKSFMLMQVYVYPYPVTITGEIPPPPPPPPPPLLAPEVVSFKINNGEIFSEGSTVITTNITENNPTHYRIGKFSSVEDGEWKPYSTTVPFELYKIGLNTIYFQTKNDNGISNIVSSSIGWAGTENHEFEETVPPLEVTVTDGISFNYNTLTKSYSDSVPTLNQVVTDEAIVIKF